MEQYVGLDVSLEKTSICVVDRGGKIICEGTVVSDLEAIASFIGAKAPGAIRIGLETGPTSTWLWTEPHRLGLPVICIDARHAEAALSMQINKSDRHDAVGIARIMQCGWYKEVWVKSAESPTIKSLLCSRALLIKMRRDLENQMRGLLKNLGLLIGKTGGNVFCVAGPRSDRGKASPLCRRDAIARGSSCHSSGTQRVGTQGALRLSLPAPTISRQPWV